MDKIRQWQRNHKRKRSEEEQVGKPGQPSSNPSSSSSTPRPPQPSKKKKKGKGNKLKFDNEVRLQTDLRCNRNREPNFPFKYGRHDDSERPLESIRNLFNHTYSSDHNNTTISRLTLNEALSIDFKTRECFSGSKGFQSNLPSDFTPSNSEEVFVHKCNISFRVFEEYNKFRNEITHYDLLKLSQMDDAELIPRIENIIRFIVLKYQIHKEIKEIVVLTPYEQLEGEHWSDGFKPDAKPRKWFRFSLVRDVDGYLMVNQRWQSKEERGNHLTHLGYLLMQVFGPCRKEPEEFKKLGNRRSNWKRLRSKLLDKIRKGEKPESKLKPDVKGPDYIPPEKHNFTPRTTRPLDLLIESSLQLNHDADTSPNCPKWGGDRDLLIQQCLQEVESKSMRTGLIRTFLTDLLVATELEAQEKAQKKDQEAQDQLNSNPSTSKSPPQPHSSPITSSSIHSGDSSSLSDLSSSKSEDAKEKNMIDLINFSGSDLTDLADLEVGDDLDLEPQSIPSATPEPSTSTSGTSPMIRRISKFWEERIRNQFPERMRGVLGHLDSLREWSLLGTRDEKQTFEFQHSMKVLGSAETNRDGQVRTDLNTAIYIDENHRLYERIHQTNANRLLEARQLEALPSTSWAVGKMISRTWLRRLKELVGFFPSINFVHNYPSGAGPGAGTVTTSHTDHLDHNRIPCGVHSFSTFYEKDKDGNWIMKEHDPMGFGLVLDDLGIEIASRSGDSTFFASQFLSHHNKPPVETEKVPRSSLVTFCSKAFISGLSLKLQMVISAEEETKKAAIESKETKQHPHLLSSETFFRLKDGERATGTTPQSKAEIDVKTRKNVFEQMLERAFLGLDGLQDKAFAKYRAWRESNGKTF